MKIVAYAAEAAKQRIWGIYLSSKKYASEVKDLFLLRPQSNTYECYILHFGEFTFNVSLQGKTYDCLKRIGKKHAAILFHRSRDPSHE